MRAAKQTIRKVIVQRLDKKMIAADLSLSLFHPHKQQIISLSLLDNLTNSPLSLTHMNYIQTHIPTHADTHLANIYLFHLVCVCERV